MTQFGAPVWNPPWMAGEADWKPALRPVLPLLIRSWYQPKKFYQLDKLFRA